MIPSGRAGRTAAISSAVRPDDKAEKPRVKQAPSRDDKAGDLERKLERLLKEVEELKMELKKSRSGVSSFKYPTETRLAR